MPVANTLLFDRPFPPRNFTARASFGPGTRGDPASCLITPNVDDDDLFADSAIAAAKTHGAAVVINARGAILRSNQAYRARRDFFGAVVTDIVSRLGKDAAGAPPARGSQEKVTLVFGKRGSLGMWFDGDRERIGALFRVRELGRGSRLRLITLRQPGEALKGCDPAFLEQALGLTPAEARLACALMQRKSLPLAIRDLGLKEKTGRTYLDRIFTKTGSKSQLQLFAILTEIYLLSRERA